MVISVSNLPQQAEHQDDSSQNCRTASATIGKYVKMALE
jgi:hypothetical protein